MALNRFWACALTALLALGVALQALASESPLLIISPDPMLAEGFATKVGRGLIAYVPPENFEIGNELGTSDLLELAARSEEHWSGGNFEGVLALPWVDVVRAREWSPSNPATWIPLRNAAFLAISAALIEGSENDLSTWAIHLAHRFPRSLLCDTSDFPEACDFVSSIAPPVSDAQSSRAHSLEDISRWTSLGSIHLVQDSSTLQATYLSAAGEVRNASVRRRSNDSEDFHVLYRKLLAAREGTRALRERSKSQRRLELGSWAISGALSAATIGLASMSADRTKQHTACLEAARWACYDTDQHARLLGEARRANRATWAGVGLSVLSMGFATTVTIQGRRARQVDSLAGSPAHGSLVNGSPDVETPPDLATNP